MKTIIYVILSAILFASCSKSVDYTCTLRVRQPNGEIKIEKTFDKTFDSKEDMQSYINSTPQVDGTLIICIQK